MSKSKKGNNRIDNKLKNPDYKLAKEQFNELNKNFYSDFLESFYSIKVINLLSLITASEKSVNNFIENPIEIDRLKIVTQIEDIESDSVVKYAKAELAMSYFHCLETFIRLFIAHAKFSGCPWLELARLSITKYKKELQNIKAGKFNDFNNQITGDETILYVFTGQTKPKGEITEEFIGGYKKWLTFATNELLETYDYNSFKHGLAISPTNNGFTLGDPDQEFKLEAHGEVIEHLTRMNSKDRVIWAKQTNFVKYDEKATYILILERLIKSILDVGKETYLHGGEGIRVFKAHEFSPEDIKMTDDKQAIQIRGFKKGLLYYE